MCNLYDVGKPRGDSSDFGETLDRAISGLAKPYGIRKTDYGPVVRTQDGSRDVALARWGFHRHFNPAINNARSDKLGGGMWNEAWREKRRCVIPASSFYEWTGPKGSKQTHAIELPSGAMWMAGLWEDHSDPEIGLSFTTITTDANAAMESVHNRMPVILEPGVIDEFLNADDPMELVVPFAGEVEIYACENPLVKGAQPGPPVRFLL
jgi:putative SOS response-associated peptidase YedK